jgi:hypothetical protein
MNKKILTILILCIFITVCKKKKQAENQGNNTTTQLSQIPNDLHGTFCREHFGCSLEITSGYISQETLGFCSDIKHILKTGDSYQIVCNTTGYEDLFVKKLPDGNISVQFLRIDSFSTWTKEKNNSL